MIRTIDLCDNEAYSIEDLYTFRSTNIDKTLNFDEVIEKNQERDKCSSESFSNDRILKTKDIGDDIEKNKKKRKNSTNKNKGDFKLLADEDWINSKGKGKNSLNTKNDSNFYFFYF